MKRIGSLVAASAVLFLSGCTPQLKEFHSGDGKFTILMPADPEFKSMYLGGVNLKMWGKEAGPGGALAVGYGDIAGRPFDIHGCAGGVAQTHGGSVIFNRPVTFDGLQGREFEVAITKPRNGYCSGRVFRYKDRFFLLLAVGNNFKLDNETVQKFLTSFKIDR